MEAVPLLLVFAGFVLLAVSHFFSARSQQGAGTVESELSAEPALPDNETLLVERAERVVADFRRFAQQFRENVGRRPLGHSYRWTLQQADVTRECIETMLKENPVPKGGLLAQVKLLEGYVECLKKGWDAFHSTRRGRRSSRQLAARDAAEALETEVVA